ncbi:MAG: SRPBCC domain-containing protein [Ginsengibacter sp.]
MNKQDYTSCLTVDVSSEEAYESISNVPAWWSKDFEGKSENTGDVFTVRFGETSITIKVVDMVPGKKIMWHVIDCYKHWLKDKKEWKDTKIIWEISSQNDITKIDFTHVGLVPGIECYKGCEGAWNFYLKDSLLKLLSEGAGVPG